MNLSRLFILRPVATSLLMVAVLLVGALAYRWLPIASLPQVDYPTIQITTLYPGASPDVVTSSITAPLERQFGQMPGLDQMSSVSSGGASSIIMAAPNTRASVCSSPIITSAMRCCSTWNEARARPNCWRWRV